MADTFQYSRQSYQNRTRLRNSQGAQWVTVPLKGAQHGRPHCDTRIRHIAAWRKRQWKAFRFNYSRTPYFSHYQEALEDFFAATYTRLGEVVCASVGLTHRLWGLQSTLLRASEMDPLARTMDAVLGHFPSQTLLLPASVRKIDGHVCPMAHILHFAHPRYRQAFDGFVPDMTALDLLFNYGPDSRAVLEQGISMSTL